MPLPAARFVTTRWSLVAAAGSTSAEGRAALAWLVERAWQPLVAHVRRKGWPGQDCEDLVQSFLARIIERGDVATADAARGRFRTWLLTCLDHFLANEAEARKAQKRGGGRSGAELGAGDAVSHHDPANDLIRDWDRDWALDLLHGAIRQLEQEHADDERRKRFQVLSRFLATNGDATAYADAGRTLGLGEGAIKVAVHRLRQRLKDLLRAAVAETLSDPDPVLVDAELAELIAAIAPR